MEKFDNPYSKLLYAVYKLHSQGSISNDDKIKLKGMIVTGEESIVAVLESYLRTKNCENLIHDIVKLVRPTRYKPEAIITTKDVVDELSSPLGTFLHEKKKRQSA